jgi:hypothetical protein
MRRSPTIPAKDSGVEPEHLLLVGRGQRTDGHFRVARRLHARGCKLNRRPNGTEAESLIDRAPKPRCVEGDSAAAFGV